MMYSRILLHQPLHIMYVLCPVFKTNRYILVLPGVPHGDVLLGVYGGVQDANIEILATSITSLELSFQLDISIVSIVCTQNKNVDPK